MGRQFTLGWALVGLAMLASCGLVGSHPENPDNGECADLDDNDGDGLVDCFDPDCIGAIECGATGAVTGASTGLATGTQTGTATGTQTGAATGTPTGTATGTQTGTATSTGTTTTTPPVENCFDGIDNDLDGWTDCNDGDCDAICDADGDGYFSPVVGGDDCDDQNWTINPGAFDQCGDNIDQDCDGFDCVAGTTSTTTTGPGTWVDSFESGAINANWTAGGSAFWFATSTIATSGQYSAQSGNIGDSQTTSLELTATFTQSGSITFWHTGDTEANYDHLYFHVDGVLLDTWSGNWGWSQANYTLSTGTHSFLWVYSKDASLATGADTVWLDLVTLTHGAP